MSEPCTHDGNVIVTYPYNNPEGTNFLCRDCGRKAFLYYGSFEPAGALTPAEAGRYALNIEVERMLWNATQAAGAAT